MKPLIPIALGTVLLLASASPLTATDPPHNEVRFIDCAWCHTPHAAPGGALTAISGNVNLCQSCHQSTGPAFALDDADQALPFPGLPVGTPASGDSHRWDSGPAGHVELVGANASTGTVASGGAFTGRFAKTYTITITTAGNAGSAIFAWTDSLGGGSGGLLSGTAVPLDEGVNVSLTDGTGSPSFLLNTQWRIFVRTDINAPTDPEMVLRFADGKIMCSTCHNQHSQLLQPFDPFSPAYFGPGTGWLRHYMRVENDTNRMCVECHQARDVATSSLGSHPVGIGVPGGGEFKPPTTLPLDAAGDIACQSCHRAHRGATDDGSVMRVANTNTLCSDCHTLADTATPASHLSPASGVLWPGGQYGSSFPQITDTGKRGFCTNCHQPHGWPDDGTPAQDYPILLVDREEDLCHTCHDAGPASQNILAEFGKTYAHPLGLASGVHADDEAAVVATRHVECVDCHDSHWVKAPVSVPGPSTAPRTTAGPLDRVRGVDIAGSEADPASFEYEVCFRCHADSPGQPSASTPRQFPETNVRLEFDGSHDSFHAVALTGPLNSHVPSLMGGWASNGVLACTDCHNNNAGPATGGGGPNGPHGSTLPRLLERNYAKNFANFSTGRFALCFKCHSSAVILDDNVSFDDHDKHIEDEDTPCNVCHDPHGSAGQKFLINFDTSVAFPSGGRLEFIAPEDSGDGKGYCYVDCHGKDHDPKDYDPNYTP